MRVMMKVTIPVEAGNRAIKDGSLPKAMEETFRRLQPEAAYFTLENGDRTALFFFDMDDSSRLPVVGEPIFMGLDARIDITPVMNRDDLVKGLSQL